MNDDKEYISLNQERQHFHQVKPVVEVSDKERHDHRITESQNILSWKRPKRIFQVQLLTLHRAAPRIPSCAWECCPNAPWALAGLARWPQPWGSCSSRLSVWKQVIPGKAEHTPELSRVHSSALAGPAVLSVFPCKGHYPPVRQGF